MSPCEAWLWVRTQAVFPERGSHLSDWPWNLRSTLHTQQGVYWSSPLYLNFYLRGWSPISMSPFEAENFDLMTPYMLTCVSRDADLEAWLKAHGAVLQRPLVPRSSGSPSFLLSAEWCFVWPFDLWRTVGGAGEQETSLLLLTFLGCSCIFAFPLARTLVFPVLASPFPGLYRRGPAGALASEPPISRRWNPEQLHLGSVLLWGVLFPSCVVGPLIPDAFLVSCSP